MPACPNVIWEAKVTMKPLEAMVFREGSFLCEKNLFPSKAGKGESSTQ